MGLSFENDNHVRLFKHFLAQPKNKSNTSGDFEYIEIGEYESESGAKDQPQTIKLEEDRTENEKIADPEPNQEGILACTDNTSLPAECEPFQSLDQSNTTIQAKDNTNDNFDLSSVETTELQSAKFTPKTNLSEYENSISFENLDSSSSFQYIPYLSDQDLPNEVQEHSIRLICNNPPFEPCLSCIEEVDETWECSVFELPILTKSDEVNMDSSPTEEFKPNLFKEDTLEDLSMIGCGEDNFKQPDIQDQDVLDDLDDAEMKSIFHLKEEDALEKIEELLEKTALQKLCSEDVVETESPARSESPPVVIVDSIEEYMRSVQEQRSRTLRSPRNSDSTLSAQANLLSSDKLTQTHKSTSNISAEYIPDDYEFHYLPVSYAGVKTKKKNWIKRSVSNVRDGYSSTGKSGFKSNTLKKDLVQKLSKKYNSSESVDGALQPTSSRHEGNNDRMKLSRKSSIRNIVGRIIRNIRRNSRSKKELRDSTWSLPTTLDSIDSSSNGDFFVTESEGVVSNYM